MAMKEMVLGSEVGRRGSPSPPQALLERLNDYALARWDELSPDERDLLINDIESLNLPRIDRIIRCSLDPRGTRLGSSDPKGCFNIGLPSGKSLFQLQAERILRVQRLAAKSNNAGFIPPIHWYIMTSLFTDEATCKFFGSHKYFGLEADQVTFFQQGTLPCISSDGRFIMETPYKAYPQEKVGVFVQQGRDGPLTVVEYSEMDASVATEINQSTGRLHYCWSNVCLHMSTLDFLNQVANCLEKGSTSHLRHLVC